MVAEIQAQGLAGSTALIISAKHGQSPTDPNDLTRVDDGPIIDGINAAWQALHPDAADLVAFAVDDDGMLMWLSDTSQAASDFVKHYLLTHSAAGNSISGNPITLQSSGLKAVYAGAASAALFGVPPADPRHPDILGIAQHGVVYTGGKGKIAEHGGADQQDRNVPILVVLPGMRHGHVIAAPVETTQIAPTILGLLGMSPGDLQAVRIEHTRVLPGLGGARKALALRPVAGRKGSDLPGNRARPLMPSAGPSRRRAGPGPDSARPAVPEPGSSSLLVTAIRTLPWCQARLSVRSLADSLRDIGSECTRSVPGFRWFSLVLLRQTDPMCGCVEGAAQRGVWL